MKRALSDFPVFCMAVAAGITGGVVLCALCSAAGLKIAVLVNHLMGGSGLCSGW